MSISYILFLLVSVPFLVICITVCFSMIAYYSSLHAASLSSVFDDDYGDSEDFEEYIP